MDRKTAQTGSGTTILIIILAILAGLAVAGALYNQNRVMQLQKQVADLTNQVQEVNQQAQEAREKVAETAKEGIEDVTQALQKVENPQIRLALFQAYAKKLAAVLTPETKADLDKIVVYVEKQPVVLVKPPAQWPAEIQTAMENIKGEAQKAKVKAVAATAVKSLPGTPTPAAGKTVTLAGIWTDAGVDPIVGGQMFSLIDKTDNQTYYFQFSGSNLTSAQALVGQEVNITVKTTGTTADGMVTYEVVSGPTAAADLTPTVKPTLTVEEE